MTPTSQATPTRLWTRDYLLDLLAAHCIFASYTAMFTLIPLYVIDRGGADWQLGIIVGSFGVVGLVVRPFAGQWVYSLGAKRIAFAGTAVFGVATLLHILAVDVWLIVPARVLQGVGLALGPVATSTIVANLAPGHRRAEAMGYMGNSISAASLYAPPIAFWVLENYGFASAFIFSSAFSFVGCVAVLGMSAARIDIPTQRESAGPASSNDEGDKVPLINRHALFPTIVFVTYTLTTAPVSTFLPLLAEERNFGNPGLYFTMYSITSMISLAISGAVSDRLGRGAVIVPGLLVVGAGMFILATAEIRLLFMASGVLAGLGFGMLQPAMQSLIVDRVPPRERSSALATLQSGWDIGGSGGAFAFGPIGAVTGAATTFAIAGAGTVIGAIAYVAGSVRSRQKLTTRV